MKILIIGGGSIGQRHLRNLKALDVQDISVVDLNKEKLKEIKEKYDVGIYMDLESALKQNWDASFICTPPASHVKLALSLIDKNIPIFMEKPIASNLKEADDLMKGVKKSGALLMVGYNLNFHPQFQKIQEILEQKILGSIWGARAEFGQYLPDWHPCEDYSKEYSAKEELGGGIVLDDVHEIDYFHCLFGKVGRVFAFAEKISNLKTDTEDYAEIILNFKNNIVGSIHMDYLQRIGSRHLKIIGEKGTLEWNIKGAKLKYWFVEDKKWIVDKLNGFDFNQTYIREVQYFLDCIKDDKTPKLDIRRGHETLKIALAVKKSSKLKKIINL